MTKAQFQVSPPPQLDEATLAKGFELIREQERIHIRLRELEALQLAYFIQPLYALDFRQELAGAIKG